MITHLSLFFMIFILTSCASFEMTPEEKAMRENAKTILVTQTSPTLTELRQYQEMGQVKCEERVTTYSDADERCRDEIKYQSARLGGDLVILELREKGKCATTSSDEQCVSIKGRSYKSKPEKIR